MPNPPAFCDNCGAIFPSEIGGENSTNITYINCSSPCPYCGGKGSIPDGVYNFTGDVIRLLSGPQKTVEQLQRLAKIITAARESSEEPSQTFEKIKREAPELRSIVDILPTTRIELYAFLTLIVIAISVIIELRTEYREWVHSFFDIFHSYTFFGSFSQPIHIVWLSMI